MRVGTSTPQRKDDPITLEYHLPGFGRITTTLYDKSRDLYYMLEAGGEIQRLKQMDHLGMVRLAWEGAHHSRWEYMILMCYLFDRAKETQPGIGLSNSIKLTDRVTIKSRIELLKCWVFLLNIGHLMWTFEAERALLLEMANANDMVREEYLSALSDNQLRGWAEDILKRGDIPHFYQSLAFVRLRMIAQGVQCDYAQLEQWDHILRAYVNRSPDNYSLEQLVRLYRRIRQIAYMTLDSQYTRSILIVNLAGILNDPSLYRWILLRDDSDVDILHEVEKQLAQDVYLSESVLRVIAGHETGFRNRIRESLEADGFCVTVDRLARGEIPLGDEERVTSVVRLPVWFSYPWGLVPQPINVCEEQRRIDQLVASNGWQVRGVFSSALYGSDSVLQIHALGDNSKNQIAAYLIGTQVFGDLLERLLEDLLHLMRNDRDFELAFQEDILDNPARELIVSALALIFEEPVCWQWKPDRAMNVRAIVGRPRRIARLLRHLSETEGIDASRSAELRALSSVVGKRGRYVAVTCRNLIAFRDPAGTRGGTEGRDMVAELDGVVVRVLDKLDKPAVEISLVEVKDRRKGGISAANDKVRQTLKELKQRSSLRPRVSSRKVSGLTYATARFWIQIESGTPEIVNPAEEDNTVRDRQANVQRSDNSPLAGS